MKSASSFLNNTVVTPGRGLGAAKNNPGDNTGTGSDKETFNDPYYGQVAVIESYKEAGISNTDETTDNSDMRDALEEMVAKKVNSVAEWNPSTLYDTHQLVMYKGLQFYNHNITGNLAKPPMQNPDFWYYAGTPEELIKQFFDATPLSGGMHDISNRSHTNYQQSALIGKYRVGKKGDNYYNFYRVALDGTQITGDVNLEAIFDVGGPNEYFKLDLYAPDDLGVRTLIDIGARHLVPQTFGDENDVVGGVLEDRFQGHSHQLENLSQGGTVNGIANNAGSDDNKLARGDSSSRASVWASLMTSDQTNGTPRTGATTRPKELTEGISYLIIAKPA